VLVNKSPLKVVFPGRISLPGVQSCRDPANIDPIPLRGSTASKTCPSPRSASRAETIGGDPVSEQDNRSGSDKFSINFTDTRPRSRIRERARSGNPQTMSVACPPGPRRSSFEPAESSRARSLMLDTERCSVINGGLSERSRTFPHIPLAIYTMILYKYNVTITNINAISFI
jgi:hypothetical protein